MSYDIDIEQPDRDPDFTVPGDDDKVYSPYHVWVEEHIFGVLHDGLDGPVTCFNHIDPSAPNDNALDHVLQAEASGNNGAEVQRLVSNYIAERILLEDADDQTS